MRNRPSLPACWFAALLTLSLLPAASLHAQGPPLFTRDYYLVEPARWVDKPITVSVTHIEPGDVPEGALRKLKAHTYFNGQEGGKLDVIATEAAAIGLLRQCGTQKQPLGKKLFRTTQIHGVLKRGTSGGGGSYYLSVEK